MRHSRWWCTLCGSIMHSNRNRTVLRVIRSYGETFQSTMTSLLYKWTINRFLKDNQFTKFGVEDPYYEQIPIPSADGKPTAYKKVARTIPPGLSPNDILVLQNVQKQAYRSDMWFSVLGLKFGLASIVGIIPVVGFLVGNYWSLKIFFAARQLDEGLPLDIQLIFLFNIVVDFLLSLIPFVGDIIEIGYKANLRNFLLLEKHLLRLGQKNLGIILESEVRPGFINDKVQPFIEETVKPNAIKAGSQVKKLVNKQIRASSSLSSLAGTTSGATTQSTKATATGLLEKVDDDICSIKSLHETKKRALGSENESDA